MSERMQKGKTKGQQIEYLKAKLSGKNAQLKVLKKKVSHDFKNAVEALEIIYKHNKLKNDLESYLMYVATWGMGKGPKPNPEDFGIDEE